MHLTGMNAHTRLSEKGQVVIPKDVRDRLHLVPGDRLDVIERADGVLLRKAAVKSGESFETITARIRSRVRYDGPPVSIEEMRTAIDDMWAAGGPRWDG
jgi:AbrB family looped-hinge helix DNA binding protein